MATSPRQTQTTLKPRQSSPKWQLFQKLIKIRFCGLMRPIPLVCVQYSISEMSIVTRWGTVLLINNLLTFAFLPESRSLVQCQYVSSVHAVSTIRDTFFKETSTHKIEKFTKPLIKDAFIEVSSPSFGLPYKRYCVHCCE